MTHAHLPSARFQKHNPIRRFISLSQGVLVGAFFGALELPGQRVELNVEVLEEDKAPYRPANTSFKEFSCDGIANSGRIFFYASLFHIIDEYKNETYGSFWVGNSRGMNLLSWVGQAVGGLAPDVAPLHLLNAWAGNSVDQAVGPVILTGPTWPPNNNGALLLTAPGHSLALIRTSHDKPQTPPGVLFTGLPSFALNDAGQVLIKYGDIWRVKEGQWAKVAGSGDPAPGTAENTKFTSISQDGGSLINRRGNTVFVADIEGPEISSSLNGSGIWMGAPGNTRKLVQSYDQAAGVNEGFKYNDFTAQGITLNSADQCVFVASLDDEFGNRAGRGIWIGTPGSIRLIAMSGDLAPGAGPGVMFKDFGSAGINKLGRCVFVAQVEGAGITDLNDMGLWYGAPGALAKIYQEGDPAPVQGDPMVFADTESRPFYFALNDRGEVAFYSAIKPPGSQNYGRPSVWIATASGDLQFAAERGGSVKTAGGMRSLSDISFAAPNNNMSGDENGRLSPFNDNGQAVFTAVVYKPDPNVTQPRTYSAIVTAKLTAPTAAEQWRQTYFQSSENMGAASDLADPDADGMANVLERVFGTDPLSSGEMPLNGKWTETGFHLEYPLSRKAISDIDIEVEVSVDGTEGSWVTGVTKSTFLGDADPVSRMRATHGVSNRELFFRLTARPRHLESP